MQTVCGILVACLLLIAGPAFAGPEFSAVAGFLEVGRAGPQGWEATTQSNPWFAGRAAGPDALNRGTMAAVLHRLQPDAALRTRGAKEVSIYQAASPSVVLVATNEGIGSGSLITKDGKILTNWHVIGGNAEVGVVFKPKTEEGKITSRDVRRARVLQIDQVADLALVHVSSVPQGVLPLTLGRPSDISVGSDVHAIGHPTGEMWTYTRGLVSQIRKGYEWVSEEDKLNHKADVIQTQTPINPGNSGGPLLSDAGRLVGVNSFRKSGEGLNFAVASSEVEAFLTRGSSRVVSRTQPVTPPAAAAGTCTPVLAKPTRSKSNDATVRAVDLDCDGTVDGVLVIPDETSKAILLVIDSNHDGKPDIVIMDLDRDGKWDISYYDVDHDGKWDLVGHHPDGNLAASRYEPYTG